jgi:hypothetical protein
VLFLYSIKHLKGLEPTETKERKGVRVFGTFLKGCLNGATTLSIMTVSIMTHSMMTVTIITHSMMTLGIIINKVRHLA